MKISINQIGNIESNYGSFHEHYEEDNSLPETHSCELCGENEAFVEVMYPKTERVPYNRSELICMECYSSKDYQEIIFKQKPIRKLI